MKPASHSERVQTYQPISSIIAISPGTTPINQWAFWHAVFLIALAWFAVSPIAQAVSPPPDGGYPGFNTANGANALVSNNIGANNTANGAQALFSNETGSGNTANGYAALSSNTTGGSNTACGYQALLQSTDSSNTAIGHYAGSNLTTGRHNIYIDNLGAMEEDGTIRIGESQTATYLAGIAGQTVGAGGTTCYVDNAGKLGVFLSARRYKQNIQRMDDASAALFSLKPVTFCYKPEFDESGTPHFGLIAEEVAEVAPDLVVRNAEGELSTVRYEAVNAMLLNEFLKEHRKVQEQQATIDELKSTVAQQEEGMKAFAATLRGQASQIQKVSAQLEAKSPAAQTVFNNH